jgi:hypothetical protein
VARNLQKENSFKVFRNQQSEIHSEGIKVVPDRQIWEKLHRGLVVRCFDISEFSAIRSVEELGSSRSRTREANLNR